MRKLFTIIVALLISGFSVSAISKADKKQIIQEAKALEKAGWYSDSPKSIKDLLLEVEEYINSGKLVFVGSAYNYPRMDSAKRAARRNAISEISEFCSGSSSVIIDSIASKDSDNKSQYRAESHRIVNVNEATNKAKVLFTIIKNKESKKYDCRVYLLLDPNDFDSK